MPKIADELSALEVSRLKSLGFHSVGGVPGLAMHISKSGARSWILRIKVGDKRRDMGLGSFGDVHSDSKPPVSLAQARERARVARLMVDEGRDPILERDQAKSLLRAEQARAVTFEQAALKYIASKKAEWSNAKHGKQWLATLEQYAFPVMGGLHVGHIGQQHVLKVLEPIWTTKTETASRLRGRIENVLDWAAVKGHRTGDNPARWRGYLDKLLPAPQKVATIEHHPAVPVDDAPAFYAALCDRDGTSARALQFAMLTAARSGEVRGARWTEIDLEKRLWTIPGARMKAKQEHRVPLSDAVLHLLRSLPRFEGVDFVFPSPKSKQLSDMALTGVMRRMGLAYVPHGLRSTFRDWAAERTEFPRDLAEKALAHALGDKTEAAYRRGDMMDRRAVMMESWAGFLGSSFGQAAK